MDEVSDKIATQCVKKAKGDLDEAMEILLIKQMYPKENMKTRKRSESLTMKNATAETTATTGRITQDKTVPKIKKRVSKQQKVDNSVSEHFGAEEALLD